MSKAIFAFSLVLVSGLAAQANEARPSHYTKLAMVRPAPKPAQAVHQNVAMNSKVKQTNAKPPKAQVTLEIDEGD